jgi:hypothetical protein
MDILLVDTSSAAALRPLSPVAQGIIRSSSQCGSGICPASVDRRTFRRLQILNPPNGADQRKSSKESCSFERRTP